MEDEYEQDQSSSAESTQTGGTPPNDELQPGDDGYVEPTEDTAALEAAQAEAQAQAEADEEAAKAARTPATSPYAQTSDPLSFDADLRAELEGWLPESAVAKLDAHLNRVATTIAKAETQKYVQAYEQQVSLSSEIGVPPEYIGDLKAFNHQVPENMRGTAEGAEIALMAGLYDRARREKTTVVAQMEKLAAAKQPKPVVTSTKVPVTALAPSARTSAAPVSGRAVVPARPGKPIDPLESHFSWAKGLQ